MKLAICVKEIGAAFKNFTKTWSDHTIPSCLYIY